MLQVETITVTKGHETLSEDDKGNGRIKCNCGNTYDFSLMKSQNMVECDGFIFPCCPSCKETPHSETRRIDL